MTTQEKFSAIEETFRAMARIVNVDDVFPHTNADRLQLAIIGGWQVVILLNEFKKGDKALYCEIDALVPTVRQEFAFLEVRGENIKSIEDKTYCRIKTIRLRKELSQGLLVPVPAEFRSLPVGTDLTKELGVLKYEKVIKYENTTIPRNLNWFTRLAGWIYGEDVSLLKPWPFFLNKSEQPRIQNINSQYNAAVAVGEPFEESVKLNGSSMTCYSIVENFQLRTGVCSRNCEISQEDIVFTTFQAIRRWVGSFMARNRRSVMIRKFVFPTAYKEAKEGSKLANWLKEFWNLNKDVVRINIVIPEFSKVLVAANDQFLKYALQEKIMQVLKKEYETSGHAFTVQGELVGPGIQDNFEGLDRLEFYVYNIFLNGNNVVLPEKARLICKRLGLKYVPVPIEVTLLPALPKDALKCADGPRALAKGGYREGLVYKSLIRDFSFKCVSNRFLEKED